MFKEKIVFIYLNHIVTSESGAQKEKKIPHHCIFLKKSFYSLKISCRCMDYVLPKTFSF